MNNEKELMAVELTDAELETIDGGKSAGSSTSSNDFSIGWERTRGNPQTDDFWSKYSASYSNTNGVNSASLGFDIHGKF